MAAHHALRRALALASFSSSSSSCAAFSSRPVAAAASAARSPRPSPAAASSAPAPAPLSPAAALAAAASAAAAVPPAGIDAAAGLRVRRGADAISALDANPYGWPAASRAAKEAPLWMLYEAEREEAPLAGAAAHTERAARDLSTTLLDMPMLDAQGRAYATGRRKTSAARVWVRLGEGRFSINGKGLEEYFSRITLRQACIHPFVTTQSAGAFDVVATVRGGGLSGQAGAVKHGVARALARFDPYLKPVLRRFGQIHRDPRMVERKKPGLRKARAAFQWVKR